MPTAELAGLSLPTLVLTGDDDRIIPAHSSRLLAERIPGAQMRVISGTGHLFFLERREQTFEILTSFLGAAADSPRA